MNAKVIKVFRYLNIHKYLQKFSKFVNVMAGLGVVGLGLILASWMNAPLTGLIATAFSVCGTIIWFPALAEMKTQDQYQGSHKEEIDKAITTARLEWESDEQKKIIDQLRKTARKQLSENENLQMQVANLRATQMTATSLQQNWEMVLLEVDHKISDWQERRLYDSDSSTFSRAEHHVYRGLLDKSFTAKLGFSLDLLRVHVPEGSSTLLVSMPAVALVGVSKINTNWRHKHVEVCLLEGTVRGGERQIHDQYRGLQQAADTQSRELEARVNNGVDLEYLHEPVREMAKRILRSMLSPLHNDIQFVPELSVHGTSLAEYLEARRIDAESRLTELKHRQLELLEQMERPRIS